MVKIERLLNNATATFTRNGASMPVTLNMTMTAEEFQTLKVIAGTVVASIDETKIVEISAQNAPPVQASPTTAAVEPAPAAQPFVDPQSNKAETIVIDPRLTKPAIVTPASRK